VKEMSENCFITKTLQGKLLYDQKLMITYKINYPELHKEIPAAKRFNRYYMLDAKRTENRVKTTLYREAVKQYQFATKNGYPFFNYEVLQVFETTLCDKTYISFYYDLYEYTGGAHGMTERTGGSWNILTGKYFYNVGELFAKGYDYRKVIYENVLEQAKMRQQKGEADYFENLEQNIVQYFDPKNFYLTPEALAVFYPLYSIAPYVAGIQVFEIPYSKFGNEIIHYPK
jgi:hypothetical protein